MTSQTMYAPSLMPSAHRAHERARWCYKYFLKMTIPNVITELTETTHRSRLVRRSGVSLKISARQTIYHGIYIGPFAGSGFTLNHSKVALLASYYRPVRDLKFAFNMVPKPCLLKNFLWKFPCLNTHNVTIWFLGLQPLSIGVPLETDIFIGQYMWRRRKRALPRTKGEAGARSNNLAGADPRFR
jgi:hypothetical protein